MEERVIGVEREPVKGRRWLKWLLVILGVLLVVIAGGVIFGKSYINKSLPQLEGEIHLPGLQENVSVNTDPNGVPHIQAANDHDLYMAQGYVQAQNRIFQMELSRRQASGTLSEVVGADAIDQDKYFRTLGLRRAAEASYDLYSEEAKAVLNAFADGVNAYIKEATEANTLPVEFTLMGIEPTEWTVIDSLTIGKYMAFDLGGHWERQAFNYYALQHFPEDKALELFPRYPEEKPTIIGDGELDIAASFDKAVIPHDFNGSNNWAVSGEKTKSGMPLLADDPHLGLATPSIWVQMVLETGDMKVDGVIFAGIPGIILGHNNHVAWGVTNVGPDVQQLYIEKQNPDNADEYLFEDKWEKAEIIDEPIHVKDGDTIDYEVAETRHGPILSEFTKNSGRGEVMSLRWTALDPTTELEAILEINRATDWNEFETGLEKFLSPAQNFVFAAKDGTIAYKANGNIPIYESADDALLPLPGWEADKEWQGFIPFDELPRVVNPEKGFIATANNKIVGDDYPYHISNVWAQPYRYERIAEVLDSGEDLTVQDMQNLQMDATNLQAREFVPLFEQELVDVSLTDEAEQALKQLKNWDFVDDKDEAAPLIFHHWYSELEDLIYGQQIQQTMMEMFSVKGQTTDELLRTAFNGGNSIWIEEAGGIEDILQRSLEKTVTDLADDYGKDIEDWVWGDYHQVQFKHPLSGVNPILAYFFNNKKPLPVDGSSVTPMAAAYKSKTGEVNHGASWRFVIDTANLDTGYHIVGPGQFGHFRSEWYDDQVEDWVEGHYHETTFNTHEGKKLKLVP
ncbi:Penicillin amidase [Lentibacillus sp. JNUCC-1]|uniref:penicillin acylase family protein n=1 Tax=Lentibacillus sp. JNUCC-1 TaxID=2654513 RepID=UPI0012E7AB69|nr:penicillin acylase family protein [Lentibacillus sp. JNUCC-1]MUV38452.1 Penicillin amidase [Lentibacillus sp. JNUCC-1]